MRLISCHVENYGKLSNVDLDFDRGITEFFLKNGEGKTTLASFIRAMFYGLPTHTASEKTLGERKHYLPFGGGIFGGNLIFEKSGRIYMIERRFDKKSKTRDEAVVYCNGNITDEFGIDPIGRQIFGLDENSFMRTLFVTSADMALAATDGISGKLNNYAEGNIDLNKATELLGSAAKRYRAARGNTKGLIPESESRVAELRLEIENLEAIDKTLEGSYRGRTELQLQIEQLRKKIAEAQASELLGQKWKTYDSILSSVTDAEKSLDELDKKYPRGIPLPQRITEAEEDLASFERTSARLSATSFGDEKEQRLASLDRLFASGEPSAEELDGVRSELDSIVDRDAYIETLRRTEPNGRDREIVERFSKGIPNSSELLHMDALARTYRERSNALLGHTAQSIENNTDAPAKKRTGIAAVLFILGAVAIAGGALTLVLSMIAGVIVMLVGALLLVGGGFMYLNRRMSAMERASLNSDGDIISIQLQMREAENNLCALLGLYGYVCENGVLAELQRLKSDLDAYAVLLEIEKKRIAEIDECVSMRRASENYVKEFLKEYGFDGTDMRRELGELERKISDREALTEEKRSCEKNRENDILAAQMLKTKLGDFFEAYRDGVPQDMRAKLDLLKKDISMRSVYEENRDRFSSMARDYFEKEGLTERPHELDTDTEELLQNLDELRKRLNILDGQIAEDESKTAKLDERRSELEKVLEAIEEYKEEYRLLKSCSELLEIADANLTERYIAPIRDRFSYYAKAVEGSFGERVMLDRDFCVMFEKNGSMRDHNHLSTGQRAVWSLCLRLAFIDELFGDESPFMILDDPFVALDASNMQGVAELMQTLSKERQMIYFCCHESRRI